MGCCAADGGKMAVFRACMGPRLQEEIDRSGQGLRRFPEDIVRHRKRLLTLILDGNALQELPQVREPAPSTLLLSPASLPVFCPTFSRVRKWRIVWPVCGLCAHWPG